MAAASSMPMTVRFDPGADAAYRTTAAAACLAATAASAAAAVAIATAMALWSGSSTRGSKNAASFPGPAPTAVAGRRKLHLLFSLAPGVDAGVTDACELHAGTHRGVSSGPVLWSPASLPLSFLPGKKLRSHLPALPIRAGGAELALTGLCQALRDLADCEGQHSAVALQQKRPSIR